MLDSIDYFKNISGQFEEYSSSSRIATTYKYAIDTEKQRGISSKEDKLAKKRTIIYNEGKKKSLMMRSIPIKRQNGTRKEETMNY